LPASPGFYHNPKTIPDLVNHVVGKIMDTLGVESNLFRRWGD
jgi:4-hydroxy-3-polyprenylbenzoate decarboxylase